MAAWFAFRRRSHRAAAVLGLFVAAAAVAAGLYGKSVQETIRTYRAVLAKGGGAYFSYQIHDGELNAEASPELPVWLDSPTGEAAAYVHSLAYIDLRGPHFGDDDLRSLSGAPWLQWLALSNSRTTDAGVARVVQFTPRLRRLELENTLVSDASLDSLVRLRSLEWLFLDATAVTPAGLARLRQALPNCRIDTAGPIVTASP